MQYIVSNPFYSVVQPYSGIINTHSFCENNRSLCSIRYADKTTHCYKLHGTSCSNKQVVLTLVSIILFRLARMEEKVKTAFFGNVAYTSPQGILSPEQALKHAGIYLENGSKTDDPSIALVLCHDTDVTLYQAKRHVKHDKNPALAKRIATTYISLGHLLTYHGRADGAHASFRRAKKLGYVLSPSTYLTKGSHRGTLPN